MKSKLIIKLAGMAGTLMLALAPGAAFAGTPGGNGTEGKVTICHATNAVKNPYVKITVDTSAADGSNDRGDHFSEHQGPLPQTEAEAQTMKDNKQSWGDIIPPVPGKHSGLNWTQAGQAMYNAGCNFVQGGQGGGGGTTTTQTTRQQQQGSAQTQARGGAGAAQVQVPAGAVATGAGGAATSSDSVALAGLTGSLLSLLAGMAWMQRRGLKVS